MTATKCPICDSQNFHEKVESTSFVSCGQNLTYSRRFDYCDDCLSSLMSPEQISQNRRAMVRSELVAQGLPDPARITEWRKHWGFNQRTAGLLLKVGPTAFSKYENCALTPSGPTGQLLKLLIAYDDATIELARLSKIAIQFSEGQHRLHSLPNRKFVNEYSMGGIPTVVLKRTNVELISPPKEERSCDPSTTTPA